LKSYHDFSFISEIASYFDEMLDIIYIYRNPVDVIASF